MTHVLPKILAFDIFGTVVDWHGSIAREVDAMLLGVSGDAFALAWRAGYQPAMRRVMSGELGWTLIDDLHRAILDELLAKLGLTHLDEAQKKHLNKVWHADREGLCSSEFIVMPGNDEIDSNFLRYRLNSSDFVRFANSLNAGARFFSSPPPAIAAASTALI